MTKTKTNPPSKIDIVNYNYLINKPEKDKTLIDLIDISVLEEKFPELKS